MQLRKINYSGFTLVEVLVSIIIISFVSMGIISMQSSFSKSTTSRKISTALTDVANSEIERLKAGDTKVMYKTEYILGDSSKMNVYTCIVTAEDLNSTTAVVNFSPPLDTDPNPCKNVTVRTTDGLIYSAPDTLISATDLKTKFNKSKTVTLQTNICKFK